MEKFYNINTFPYHKLFNIPNVKRPVGNNAGRQHEKKIKDMVITFDIETTRIPEIEQAVMYHWQCCILLSLEEYYICCGRQWETWLKFTEKILSLYPEDEKIVIWDHNLSYEFNWLKALYDLKSEDVFATDRRKVLFFRSGRIEYRCSYLHSNMSLKEYTHKLNVPHPKLDDFEYTAQRFPWSRIKPSERAYMINDVLGLAEALYIEMQFDGDNLLTVPRTSTGYVRREVKKALHDFRPKLKEILPDADIYKLLRELFRGGDTHGNRLIAGQIIENAKGVDESSAYPGEQLNKLFPMGEWQKATQCDNETFNDLVFRFKRAVIFRARFYNIRLHDPHWPAPYLTKDKSRNIQNGWYDNGRVLSADYLETSLTDIDFKIIVETYDFDDFQPYDIYYCRYGKLPKKMRDVVISLYKDKTALKGVPGQEVYYMKQKNKLNAVYGMTCQDVGKAEIKFIDNKFVIPDYDINEIIAKANKRAFISYAWGCYTTAHARHDLFKGQKHIYETPGAVLLYWDTDSLKYTGNVDWSDFNEKIRKRSEKNGAFAADRTGTVHYMSVFEDETGGIPYEKFCTLGAKKYVYTHNGKLHITIAGVNKRLGAQELGTIENFKPGFVFHKAGGTEAVYNDENFGMYKIGKHEIMIISNMVIRESEYTLGITGEYERLLTMPEIWVGQYYKDLVRFDATENSEQ